MGKRLTFPCAWTAVEAHENHFLFLVSSDLGFHQIFVCLHVHCSMPHTQKQNWVCCCVSLCGHVHAAFGGTLYLWYWCMCLACQSCIYRWRRLTFFDVTVNLGTIVCNWRFLQRIEKKIRMSFEFWNGVIAGSKALKRVEITTLLCTVVYFLFTVLEWRTKCSMTLVAIRTTIKVKSGCPNFVPGSQYCLCVKTEFAFAIQAPRNLIASPDKKFNPCQ